MALDRERVSSADPKYTLGELSVFPEELDTASTLFTAVNSGLTTLFAPVSFESSVIPVNNTDSFPGEGLLVIDREVIYYGARGSKFFSDIIRGFAGVRSTHEMGAEVKASVCADHHNAARDAILSIQQEVGLSSDAATESTIHGRLRKLEEAFLSLRAIFSAVRIEGQPEEIFSFKDLSSGSPISWVWEFGDESSSKERNPHHSYSLSADGSTASYDVSLTITDVDGAVSYVKKNNYIQIGVPDIRIYTEATEYNLVGGEAEVTFYDQSSGFITERRWSFGDGQEALVTDMMETEVAHTYQEIGEFTVRLSVQTSLGPALGPSESLVIMVV